MYTISAVEREVGLSKDVLRVWERRYGVPPPARDARGDRVYPAETVARLRLVKRLMDAGHRPGRLLSQPLAALQELAAGAAAGAVRAAPPEAAAAAESELLALVGRHDAAGLARALQQRLAQLGLARFVQDIIAPMTVRVGAEWARGCIDIHEEHLFTEASVRVLRQGIAAVPAGQGPTVLLTTVPAEPHSLGLLMVESMLALEGARCINLGTQLPVQEIVRAAQVHRANVVGLSFSAAFNARSIPGVLQQLRAALDPEVQLWAGGQAMQRVRPVEGVKSLVSLQGALAELGAAPAALS